MTERQHCEKAAHELLVEARRTGRPIDEIDVALVVERERELAREEEVARDQARLEAELLKFGCTPDPEWGPGDLDAYTIAPREHVRRKNRGSDAMLIRIEDGLHVHWALMAWVGHPQDEPGAARFELVMRGYGPTDSLREPRHTYFGPSARQPGYLFYVAPKPIDWAFDQLREFFDFDGDQP